MLEALQNKSDGKKAEKICTNVCQLQDMKWPNIHAFGAPRLGWVNIFE